MSYILDALRKSEQQRRPGATSRPSGAVHDISRPLPDGGWLILIGLVLLLGLLAAAFFFWRSTVSKVATIAPTPVAAAPASSVAVPIPAAPSTEKTMPVLSQTPLNTVKNETPVRDLADEAQVPMAPKPKLKPKSKLQSNTKPAPSPLKHTITAKAVPQKTESATTVATDNTPLLQKMPQEFQNALPPIAVTIHVYSQDASQRILFINNREYHVGDRIEGGVRVEEIVADGTVLSFRSERFKIARPR
ncbi:MAG: general secretion pathway protein GspB [Gammaproteobacteria bacterium]|nr:general secretion pathway protein GspB [Gammaproteobacteria bacterium]